MEVIHTILHPVFSTAVRDGIIRLNPTDGVMNEIKRTHNWEKPKRKALTEAQQSAFISYVSSSPDLQALAVGYLQCCWGQAAGRRSGGAALAGL